MTTANRPLRLMETFHNLFYTPIYVAVGGGSLAQQGLDVSLHTAPPGKTVGELLRACEVDIVQTGVSRSFMDLDAGHDDAPLHIAEINQRDGFFLVSHKPTAGGGPGKTRRARPSSLSGSRPCRRPRFGTRCWNTVSISPRPASPRVVGGPSAGHFP